MPKQSSLPQHFVLALVSGLTSVPAFAQEPVTAWPSKPVMIVRPNVPGGGDAEPRLYGEKLAAIFGKPFVLDYKPGASGSIGATYVARAAPDGYTYLAATTSFSVAPAFNDKLPYDVIKDFTAVSMMSTAPIVLVGVSSFPPSSLAEYIAYAKANPGKILWATSGAGATNHLSGELLHSEIKADATFVHYKGGAPQITPDLLAGRVHVFPQSVPNAMALIRSGKLKAIVMLSRNRNSQLPDVRTAQEQGIDVDQPNYFGFVTTAGTPPAIVARLSAELAKVAKYPDVVKKMEDDGNVMVGSTPAEFGQYIASQVTRWTKLVKEKNIKQE